MILHEQVVTVERIVRSSLFYSWKFHLSDADLRKASAPVLTNLRLSDNTFLQRYANCTLPDSGSIETNFKAVIVGDPFGMYAIDAIQVVGGAFLTRAGTVWQPKLDVWVRRCADKSVRVVGADAQKVLSDPTLSFTCTGCEQRLPNSELVAVHGVCKGCAPRAKSTRPRRIELIRGVA